MVRRSTSKFATINLALSGNEFIEVPIYYRKEGDEQLGFFLTKPEQHCTDKGRTVFIREIKDQAPRSLCDRLKEDIERQLEPRVNFEPAFTRAGRFHLPDLQNVISRRGDKTDLKQESTIYAAEYLGKHYSFVRSGTYPVSEGVVIKDPDKVLVNRTAPDLIELRKEIDRLHEKFYADVCELWKAVEIARDDATKKFASGEKPIPTEQQPQEQPHPSLDTILNTYKSI